jgi:hypothetical protein
MEVTIKSAVLCIVMLCSSESQTFRMNTSPPYSGSNSKRSKKSAQTGGKFNSAKIPAASAGFLFGLLFNREDGGDTFLRNIGLPPNSTVLQARRQSSSKIMPTCVCIYSCYIYLTET